MKKKVLFMLACAIGALTMQAETFVKVTDASTLQDGDKVVMGYHSDVVSKVSGGFSDTKKFLTAVDATFADGKATLDNPTVISLKKSGSFWKLFIGTHAVGHASGSNDLDTKYRYETEYAINIESNGIAKIVSQTPGKNNNQVYFRYNAGSPRFNVYAANSTAVDIELYKLDESSIPEVVVTSVSLNKKSLTLRIDENETLSATVKPDDAVDKSIAWGTTDASIATVVDGVVTAKAEGTVKIWVKATAVENVSDTCVVTVLPKAAEGNATYNVVQSAEYLPEGAIVFIGTVKSGENYVMGQYVSGNNIKGTAATYGDERHSVTAPKQVAYTVHIENGKYVFVDHDGLYLICNGEKKLISSSTKDSKAQWTLGAFDEDDASVTLTNAYYTSYGIFNNWQGTNDMFSAYGGVGDGSNLAKIVLYSDKAPEWVAPVKDPWIQVESTTIDWGKQEPVEGYTNYWSEAKYVKLTMNDLPANIDVELTNDANGAFTCYTTTISANKTSEQFLVSWAVEQAGKYEGELVLSCQGLEPIKIKLLAEAVAKGGGGGEEEEAELTVSADHIYLNPNYEIGGDEATFTFTAKNLAKPLYLKWERDVTKPWFTYASNGSEYMQIWRVADNDYVEVYENNRVDLGTEDITDGELYLYVYAFMPGTFTCQLHFTSLKSGSKTDYAIDEIIPITIVVSEESKPDPQGLKNIESSTGIHKIMRDGQLYILRDGKTYTVTGVMIDD